MGDSIKNSFLISRYVKGVYNDRPAKPKYDKIYDLDPVISKLKCLFPLESLKLPELTDKLLVLLALVTAHRKQTISFIKISNVTETKDGLEIKIPQKIKTSRPGSYQPLLVLPTFKDNPELCVVKTLKRYCVVTKELRNNCDDLIITTRAPFRKASKDSISRRLRAFLVNCGIDKEFAPHSMRHAATSAALKKGVNLNVIKSLAGWSENSKVFNQFYNRPIVQDKTSFAKAVVLDNQ